MFKTILDKDAYQRAAVAHGDQKRRNGEPYVNHLLRVYKLLCKVGADPETRAAGLLHDVVEDTPVSLEDIRREFGDNVASLVRQCTKLPGGGFQIEDSEAWLIKLCDAFDNCTDTESVDAVSQKAARLHSYNLTKRDLFGIRNLPQGPA
jgi:(p)ppGpp synthase/HD superfamily hydrolase